MLAVLMKESLSNREPASPHPISLKVTHEQWCSEWGDPEFSPLGIWHCERLRFCSEQNANHTCSFSVTLRHLKVTYPSGCARYRSASHKSLFTLSFSWSYYTDALHQGGHPKPFGNIWSMTSRESKWVFMSLYTPVVDSCQCMAKPIQYCKVK